MNIKNLKIGILGLGYVGLPLALELGKKYNVCGFDLDKKRIKDLQSGFDKTKECSSEDIFQAKKLIFNDSIKDLQKCQFFIVTVPTPISESNDPDFSFLINASEMLAGILKKKDIVVYESTVYPGCIEEVCVPILEKKSKLKFNIDFFCGYSPERINPGDQQHKLKDIIKITSGSNEKTALFIDEIYKTIIPAGTFKAKSIKIAEAAKVIENTQRDLNIALINELSILFSKLNLDTEEVLKAAETKWNFLPFRPGLVGGHCIGVDPYYLTYKARNIGYEPKTILAGRDINNYMARYVTDKFLELIKNKNIENPKILVMGLTFKENCTDVRNSKVFEIINNIKNLNLEFQIYDPWVEKECLEKGLQEYLVKFPKINYYDGILITVGHDCFKNLGYKNIKSFGKNLSVIYDLKYLLKKSESDLRL